MAKWIGKGVLKVKAGKFLNYGDEIPKDYPKVRVAQLKAMGLVGDIVEVAKVTPFDADNAELEASHRGLMKAHEELEIKHSALLAFSDGLEASHRDLIADKDFVIDAFESLQGSNTALVDATAGLIADKDFVIAAFNFVQDVVDQIVKTEPNREIRKILNMEG